MGAQGRRGEYALRNKTLLLAATFPLVDLLFFGFFPHSLLLLLLSTPCSTRTTRVSDVRREMYDARVLLYEADTKGRWWRGGEDGSAGVVRRVI